ncbi:MAG: biopolymer transporter ExbD [Gammaproteobacteria bacterium]|jgi:biopolymer transport protein ExbD|nr:biopolymer transporter ExbD [Gammaproteobacteria bacterium]
MNLRQRRREDPEISLTPLIDVVFLLLIFFMVSTTFTKDTEITIDLPEATAAPQEQDRNTVSVIVDVEGRYFVEGRLLVNRQAQTLRDALEQEIGDAEGVTVLISADAQTPHQAVITAMDAARQAGILHVSLATRDPEP